ncbi:hypothetical protein ABZS76_32700 [Streptomyces sp. NPDC005562]|uniref:hypothetical protein n=1 Tax=Streptomyces sp. NPDC005562 TaxID=3154890 RepID=UPI00339E2776
MRNNLLSSFYSLTQRRRSPSLPAQRGDGNAWRGGLCWFWCEWSYEQQVVQVGTILGVRGELHPMTACAQCVTYLDQRTESYTAYQTGRQAALQD